MSVFRCLCVVAFVGLLWCPASAQIDVAPALKNRPPAAAPTSQISVAPIEVVRSLSEIVNDFGGGLIQGLLASKGLRSAALIAAQDDRIIASRTFGCCVSFSEVFYSDFLAPIAAMQLVERQRLKLDDAVATIVEGYGSTGITVGEVLAQRSDPAALRRIVEASSGQDFRSYVVAEHSLSSCDGRAARFTFGCRRPASRGAAQQRRVRGRSDFGAGHRRTDAADTVLDFIQHFRAGATASPRCAATAGARSSVTVSGSMPRGSRRGWSSCRTPILPTSSSSKDKRMPPSGGCWTMRCSIGFCRKARPSIQMCPKHRRRIPRRPERWPAPMRQVRNRWRRQRR